jgi:hypothetical protein
MRPPTGHRAFDWLIARPIAHRGLHDAKRGVVENTRSAFAAAMASNYAIECDVQLTADGEAVVFHDDTLDRLATAQGPLIARTSAELRSIALRGSTDRIETCLSARAGSRTGGAHHRAEECMERKCRVGPSRSAGSAILFRPLRPDVLRSGSCRGAEMRAAHHARHRCRTRDAARLAGSATGPPARAAAFAPLATHPAPFHLFRCRRPALAAGDAAASSRSSRHHMDGAIGR